VSILRLASVTCSAGSLDDQLAGQARYSRDAYFERNLRLHCLKDSLRGVVGQPDEVDEESKEARRTPDALTPAGFMRDSAADRPEARVAGARNHVDCAVMPPNTWLPWGMAFSLVFAAGAKDPVQKYRFAVP
jgi:hypothetical protein